MQQALNKLINTANAIIRTEDKQVNKIFAIAKHKFKWSRSALFNYAVQTCPDVLKELDEKAIKHYSTSKLFAAMNSQQKSLLIKRLEQIERKNKKRSK